MEVEIEKLEDVIHKLDSKIINIQSELTSIQIKNSQSQFDQIYKFRLYENDHNPEKLKAKITNYTNQIQEAKQSWQYSQSNEGLQEIQRVFNETVEYLTAVKDSRAKLQILKQENQLQQNIRSWLKDQRFSSWNLHLMGFFPKNSDIYINLGREIAHMTPKVFINMQNLFIFSTNNGPLVPSPPQHNHKLCELHGLVMALSPINTILAMLRPWAFLQTNLLGRDLLGNPPNSSDSPDGANILSAQLSPIDDPSINSNPENNYCLPNQECFRMNYPIYTTFRTLYDIQADLNPIPQTSTNSTGTTTKFPQKIHQSNPLLLKRVVAYLYTLYSNNTNMGLLRHSITQFLDTIPALQQYNILPTTTDNIPSLGESNPLHHAYELFFVKVMNSIERFINTVSENYTFQTINDNGSGDHLINPIRFDSVGSALGEMHDIASHPHSKNKHSFSPYGDRL
jgi:hypothetical protein